MAPRDRRQRRRRAAVVGGAAYAAGKHHAAEQAAPGGPSGLSPEALEQIKELAQLHEQGALTDEEFAREKAKLLAS